MKLIRPVDSEHDSTAYVLQVHPKGSYASDWLPWCGVWANNDDDALIIAGDMAVCASGGSAGIDAVRLVKVLGYGDIH